MNDYTARKVAEQQAINAVRGTLVTTVYPSEQVEAHNGLVPRHFLNSMLRVYQRADYTVSKTGGDSKHSRIEFTNNRNSAHRVVIEWSAAE